MNYDEILVKIRERIKELDAERAGLLKLLPAVAPAPDVRSTAEDRPRRRRGWTKARRLAQSRRMKAWHRSQ